MSINILGSFEIPPVSGIEQDDKQLYKIACAQVLPSEDGVFGKGGIGKLKLYTEQAAKRKADVIVFPEYFLSGATHDHWHAVRKNSNPIDPQSPTGGVQPDDDPDHFLHLIGKLAKENDIDIVAGTVVEMGSHHVPHRTDEKDNDDDQEAEEEEASNSGYKANDHDEKLFNTVYYINRQGEVAGRYTKKRLWHPERTVLSPGHELRHEAPRTFKIKTRNGVELRAGIAVCWDLAFPETFREMFDLPPAPQSRHNPLLGPDIVFAPTCWYATDAGKKGLRWNKESEAALLDSICLTRAIENECILAMTNIAGPPFPSDKKTEELTEQDAIGVGRTCVCAPFAGCVGRIESGEEALLLSAVDLRILQDAREIYRVRHDLRNAWATEQTNSKTKN